MIKQTTFTHIGYLDGLRGMAALWVMVGHILAVYWKFPPIALHMRADKPGIVAGLRIGITKAVELPWRYGLKDSKFLSKPF